MAGTYKINNRQGSKFHFLWARLKLTYSPAKFLGVSGQVDGCVDFASQVFSEVCVLRKYSHPAEKAVAGLENSSADGFPALGKSVFRAFLPVCNVVSSVAQKKGPCTHVASCVLLRR